MATLVYNRVISRILLSRGDSQKDVVEKLKNATPEEIERAARFGIQLPSQDDTVQFTL